MQFIQLSKRKAVSYTHLGAARGCLLPAACDGGRQDRSVCGGLAPVSDTHLDVYKRQVDSNKEHGEGRIDVVVYDSINARVAICEAKYTKVLENLENECDTALSLIHISCIQSVYARFKSVFEQS